MELHASYYPIKPTTLTNFITHWHTNGFWKEVSKFREESNKNGLEFYIGITWHVLDFVINSPKDIIPELTFAVSGRQFPAPDGSIRLEPHLPSYEDEYWQVFTYLTLEEAQVIADYLSLIDESEFDSRFIPKEMVDVYRAPLSPENKEEYFVLLVKLRDFYKTATNDKRAVLETEMVKRKWRESSLFLVITPFSKVFPNLYYFLGFRLPNCLCIVRVFFV
jgi:hypothetical protein